METQTRNLSTFNLEQAEYNDDMPLFDSKSFSIESKPLWYSSKLHLILINALLITLYFVLQIVVSTRFIFLLIFCLPSILAIVATIYSNQKKYRSNQAFSKSLFCISSILTACSLLILVLLSFNSITKEKSNILAVEESTLFQPVASLQQQPQLMSYSFINLEPDLNFWSKSPQFTKDTIQIDNNLCPKTGLFKKTNCKNQGFRISVLSGFFLPEYGDPTAYNVKLCSNLTRDIIFPGLNYIYDGYLCVYGSGENILQYFDDTLYWHFAELYGEKFIQFRQQQIDLNQISEDGYLPGEIKNLNYSTSINRTQIHSVVGENMLDLSTTKLIGNVDYYIYYNFISSLNYLYYGGIFVASKQGNIVPLTNASITVSANATLPRPLTTTTDQNGFFALYYFCILLSYDSIFTLVTVDYDGYLSESFVIMNGGINLLIYNYRNWIGPLILKSKTGSPCYDEETKTFDCNSGATNNATTAKFCYNSISTKTPISNTLVSLVESDDLMLYSNSIQEYTDQNGCVTYNNITYNHYFAYLNGYLKNYLPVAINGQSEYTYFTLPHKNDNYAVLFTMVWDDPSVLFTLNIILYNPATGAVLRLEGELVQNNTSIILLENFVGAYYYITVNGTVLDDAASNIYNAYGLSVVVNQYGIIEPITIFNQPLVMNKTDEWILGCFHGGGLQYLRGIDKINNGTYDYTYCPTMYYQNDSLEDYMAGTAVTLCTADPFGTCIYTFSDQSSSLWDDFQVDMFGFVLQPIVKNKYNEYLHEQSQTV